jgi:hypothetical protein
MPIKIPWEIQDTYTKHFRSLYFLSCFTRRGSCQHIFLHPLIKITNLTISSYFAKCVDKIFVFSTIFHSDSWFIGSDSLVNMFNSLWQILEFLELCRIGS